MVKFALIVAAARNGVIGRDNGLPWHLPADLKHFRAVTLGKPVIMGRKTFQSIGRPLPGRDNIVISHARSWTADGITIVPTLEAALTAARTAASARGASEAMIIGGAQIYALALPLADRVYLTEIDLSPSGDTHFPAIDPKLWQEVSRESHPAVGEFPAHSFVIFDRAADAANA